MKITTSFSIFQAQQDLLKKAAEAEAQKQLQNIVQIEPLVVPYERLSSPVVHITNESVTTKEKPKTNLALVGGVAAAALLAVIILG